MIIRLPKQKGDFARVDKKMLADPRLSWKAKGILAYLLGCPDDWVIRVDDLVKKSTNGRDSVYAAFKELKELGYAKLRTLRKDGEFVSRQWVIRDSPNEHFGKTRIGKNCIGKSPKYTKTDIILSSSKKVNCRESEFATDISSSNGEASPFILNCVTRLETFIRKARKISPQFNRTKWINEFRLLLQSIDGNKDRLKRVLKTYITQPHDEFAPQADSAGSFRKKFTQIERWAKKHFNGEWVDSYKEERLPNGQVEGTFRYNLEGADI